MLLGLTGFVDPSKDQLLNSIAPSIVEYSTQEAQEDGILNRTQLVLVEFDLSMNNSDITVKYKKEGKDKSFTQSENDAYSYVEDSCNILYGKIDRLESDPDVVFGLNDKKAKELHISKKDELIKFGNHNNELIAEFDDKRQQCLDTHNEIYN